MEMKWIDDAQKGMTLQQKGDCRWLSFPKLDQEKWLMNAFSTRFGGVSEGCLSSMNLGFGLPSEKPERVIKNYSIMSETLGFDAAKLVCSAQTHTKNVRKVTEADWGRGYTRERGWTDVDAMITDVPGTVLATVYADCVPLYFVDVRHRAIGLAHSGWRGTAQKIGLETVRLMQREYGTEPSDMLAAIGPCICQSCYEVSHEVALAFPESCSYPTHEDKYQLDLVGANREILLEAGIPSERISLANLCTCCNSDLLFSHRASGGKRGLNAAFLSILEG